MASRQIVDHCDSNDRICGDVYSQGSKEGFLEYLTVNKLGKIMNSCVGDVRCILLLPPVPSRLRTWL